MVNYILLLLSSLLFSSSTLFNKLYQKKCGSGINATISNMFFASITFCITMYIISGFSIEFSWFSFLIAFIYSICCCLSLYCGLKAFETANLSVYSMFLMMGSIVIPSIVGIIFYNEKITVEKIICFVLIFIALYLGLDKGKGSRKAVFYYFAVFFLNGMCGVLSKIHQSYNDPSQIVDTQSFLFLGGAIRLFICLIVVGIFWVKSGKNTLMFKGAQHAVASNLLNSIGNYFGILVLIYIEISVHSIITTAGMLIFSFIIGKIIMKEKTGERNVIALILSVCAAVLISI